VKVQLLANGFTSRHKTEDENTNSELRTWIRNSLITLTSKEDPKNSCLQSGIRQAANLACGVQALAFYRNHCWKSERNIEWKEALEVYLSCYSEVLCKFHTSLCNQSVQ
jgi:hypothetical protein